MPLRATPPRLLFALLLGSSLLVGCGGNDSATHLASAKASLAAGDHKAAMIQLKNALTEDENNAEARFQLGKLYLDQLDLASAEKEFRRAREAGFAAGPVNAMLARILLSQHEYQRVLDELPASADGTADAVTLQALRATAILGLGRKDEARKALLQASQSAPDNPDVHLALAQLALADKDPTAAMQAVEQALRADPKHRDSLLMKGDLLRLGGKSADAAAAYRNALQIDPRHASARLALAGIALSENRLADARKDVDAALAIAPNSLQARYTQALIDFRERKTESARDRLAPILKSAPAYLPALQLAGSIEYELGNLQIAEAHLAKVVKAAPNNLHAMRLLAASQLRLGRPDDAARTLTPALNAKVQDAGLFLVAGEIAKAKKEPTRATAYFEQAAQLQPDSAAIRTELGIARLAEGDSRAMTDLQAAARMKGDSVRADTFIILSQLEKKQFDAALASIAALEEKQGASPFVWNYRGAAYLGKQDAARARDSFASALKLDAAFFPAAANLAQLDLQDGQPAAARQRFEAVLKADPKHLQAMLALADLSLRARDEKGYVSWLEKASSAQPQALQPRIALARHLLAKGEHGQALAAARGAVNAQPDDPAALELLGAVQLAMGDTTNALGSFRKLTEHRPGQALPLLRLASAQIVAKDLASARKSLQEALRLQPDFLDAQLMLGGVEIQAGRYDEAHKLAKQIQQQKPTLPPGFVLEGDVAYTRKAYPAALAAFEQAHKLAPSGAVLVRQLHVLKAMQRDEEGEKRLAAWLAAHPQDTSARAALAQHLIERKQHKAAVEHYLVLNKNSPNNLLILNNLAWSLAEAKDPRALGIAEQALKLKPDNPSVIDTLGWLLVQQGDYRRGIELLKKALSAAPDAAEIRWHLAYALNKSGDDARARQELERLINSGLAFGAEPEARRLLAELKAKGR